LAQQLQAVQDRPDHTGTIYISGSVTIPISIEASVVTFNVNIVGSTATLSVDIVASSVTFNAVVTASDIMMPVDIQAQYITLDINIAASAVTLNVNITASAVTLNVAIQSSAVTLNVAIQSSAVTLNVNISSSSVTLNVTVTNATLNVTGSVTISGTANVTITAQTVGISVQGEWQVEAGHLHYNSTKQAIASGAAYNLYETIAAGKRYFCYGASFGTLSYVSADDDPQPCECHVKVGGTAVALSVVGEGNQSAIMSFSTPIRADAGQTFGVAMVNTGTKSTYGAMTYWGYLTSV